MDRTLVLGGGGVTGIAWQVGLAAGLALHGLDLSTADRLVGTSAGSVTGTLLASLRDPVQVLDHQRSLAPQALTSKVPVAAMLGFPRGLLASGGDPERLGRVVGRWAIRRAATGRLPDAADRRAEVEARWAGIEVGPRIPDRLEIVTVTARTGRRRVWTAADEVELAQAVTASCAAPGVYPPVLLAGEEHIDGGTRSATNAELAGAENRVVVLAPFAGGVGPMPSAARQLRGVGHVVVSPDGPARRLMGRSPLDPAARQRSLRAGEEQAGRVAAQVAAIWR